MNDKESIQKIELVLKKYLNSINHNNAKYKKFIIKKNSNHRTKISRSLVRFEFDELNLPKYIFAKTYSEKKYLLNEYKIINLLQNQKFNNKNVRPINILYKSTDVLLLEGIYGKTLKEKINEALKYNSLENIKDIFYNLGQWLAELHKIDIIYLKKKYKNLNVNNENLIFKLEELLNKNKLIFKFLKEFILNNFLKNLERKIYNDCLALVHNDFDIENILIDNSNNIRIIDFEDLSIDNYYQDIGRILSKTNLHINLNYLQINGKYQEMESSFLNGYFSNKDYNKTLFSIFRIYHFLTKSEKSLRVKYKLNLVNKIIFFIRKIYFNIILLNHIIKFRKMLS